jgi:hypothetical protein
MPTCTLTIRKPFGTITLEGVESITLKINVGDHPSIWIEHKGGKATIQGTSRYVMDAMFTLTEQITDGLLDLEFYA